VGGRIHTIRDPRSPIPIELGAEFLHGAAKETMDIVRAARLRAVDIAGEHWHARAGRLGPVEDFWHDLDLVMRRIDRKKPDQSFLEFIESKPGGKSLARQRQLALDFVQGFHSADAALISAHSLADGGSPSEDDPEEQRMGRIVDGYDGVARYLNEGLNDHVWLGAVVQRVVWERGHVQLHLADGRALEAKKALITVPLGVLQARGLVLDPPIATVERALPLLHMGTVLRLACLFTEPFWEARHDLIDRTSSPYDFAFLHTTKEQIATWWTAYPTRAPLLIGWAGGPKARALGEQSLDQVTTTGLRILAEQFGTTTRRLRGLLEASWMHDWQRDPYSLGAYSYPGVGGAEASKLLAKPAARTVFFAGEAADPESRNGTVDGAIATGMRAAKQLCAHFPEPPRTTRPPFNPARGHSARRPWIRAEFP
jgi:monoamine oxidase